MKGRRPGFVLLGALLAGAAGSCVLSDVGEGPESIAGGSGGEGGTAAPCSFDEDCPPTETLCLLPSCNEGACTQLPREAGSDCEQGGLCDAEGQCLRSLGQPCVAANDCYLGFCSDGVCCDSACDGECATCELTGSVGTCSPHTSGTDPESECAGLCDGSGQCAVGNIAWYGFYGASQDQLGKVVAVDDAGATYIGIDFQGSLTIGDTSYTDGGNQAEIAIAKLGADGTPVWSKQWGGAGNDVIRNIEATSDGVVAVGYFNVSLSIPPVSMTAIDFADLWIARLEVDGDVKWAKQYGDLGSSYALDVDVLRGMEGDPDELVICGEFTNTLVFGSDTLTTGLDSNAFVARLDGFGEPLWARDWGDGDFQSAFRAAFDRQGNVVVGIHFGGAIDPSGTAPVTALGLRDGMVIKLDPQGEYLWHQRIGGAGTEYLWGLTVDPLGDVIIGGSTDGTFSAGGPMLGTGNGTDAYVIKLSGSDGSHIWSQSWGSVGNDGVWALDGDAAGNAIVAGYFSDTIDFGAGPENPVGTFPGTEAFLVKLSPGGVLLWVDVFGGEDDDLFEDVAANPLGGAAAIGHYADTIWIDGSEHTSTPGSVDAFAVMTGP